MNTDLNPWLDASRLIVTVGSGGVGKTTTAAVLGLHAALRGRRVMVLTIDPAKRLANSLGLERMGGDPTRIDLSSLGPTQGELWAMMLDARGTFDDLVAKIAPSDAMRKRILENHVYRSMADTFAGSQDYMATEKLYDLVSSEAYDLVILDTPPVKNALDFLESPSRVVQFLDERVIGWLLQPYDREAVFGSSLLRGTSNLVFKLLGAVFGKDFLDDLADFLKDFRELYAGFHKRHQAVIALLHAPSTQFVTVCSPTQSSVAVAKFFQEELQKLGLERAGVIVNQVHTIDAGKDELPEDLDALIDTLSHDMEPAVVADLKVRLVQAHAAMRKRVTAERLRIAEVHAVANPNGFFQEVPRFTGEIHDLAALHKMARAMIDR